MIRGLLLLASLGTGGCSFGPRAIERTHSQYAGAVQRVEEEQLLRNIVRLRYAESPTDLNVTAIAAQYEIAASAEARPFFSTESVSGPVFRAFSRVLPFVSVGGSDRPTVSMVPESDGTAVRQFLTPISADTLIFLAQAGWPVESVLRIWVDGLNGVPNWATPSGPVRNLNPDYTRFQRACALLQRVQDRQLGSVVAADRAVELSGPLPADAITAAAAVEAAKNGFEYRPRPDGKTWVLTRRQRQLELRVNPSGKDSPELAELAGLLNLKVGERDYELVVAAGVPDPEKNPAAPAAVLRITPRSTAQALFFLSNGVEVPGSHVAAGLVRLPPDGTDPTEATRDLFRVRSCPGHKHRRPDCAYLAVWYRDHWFYIDDRDVDSKATLFLVLQLKQVDFKRQQIGSVPALTLPVGGR